AVMEHPGKLWKIRARHTVLATGALERPLLFQNNDLPGVMLLSAAERFAGQYGVSAGRRIVVAGLDIAERAAALAGLGLNVVATVDYDTSSIIRAKGRAVLRAVEIETPAGRETIACDALLMSGGWTPNVHLLRHAEGKIRFDDAAQTFVPTGDVPDLTCIGGCAGRNPIDDGAAVVTDGVRPPEDHPRGLGYVVHRDANPRKVWVDFHNDVRLSDIRTAADEGFRSVEHLKRYTTLGMATDQGRTSNVNAILTLGDYLGKPPQSIGTTRFRPPFKPVRLGAFAGRNTGELLQPLRRTIWHDEAVGNGAILADYAGWHRAVCFPKSGETEADAVQREALAVREGVGLFDASPLGKIEVWGPDAATFLDRIYAGTMSTLKTGRVRYGLMMSEQGAIFDDGVCARLEDDLFLVGTTSGNAARVLDHLEEWHQREWPDLRVSIVPVTEQWATLSINGPRARDLLERLRPGADISAKALRHMQAVETTLGELPARILRVSFTGELCFEVSVPAVEGAGLWRAAMTAGEGLGVLPFGVESLMVMRIEKGFAHIGSETDGDTLPDDLGYGRMVANKKSDCVGRRSTERVNARRPDRRQMVGLEPLDARQAIAVGANVLSVDGKRTRGWVSSAAHSPVLERSVALAMIEGGRALTGETITLYHDGGRIEARVCAPCALDPDGERLRG
ncbi:MAG: glycine cleavage T C-terminal barrel domain-containing protein, partial [Pseudomonadota bacterium]